MTADHAYLDALNEEVDADIKAAILHLLETTPVESEAPVPKRPEPRRPVTLRAVRG